MAFFPTQDLIAKPIENYVWDPVGMAWVKETQPTGGGGGGAVTIADGADTAEGFTTDAAVTGDNPGTISAKLRGLNKLFASVWDSVNGRLKVDGSGVTQPVNGLVSANQSGPWTVHISGSSLNANSPGFATVGTTSAGVLSSNSSRTGLILINTSNNTISLGFGANPGVLNSGITLYPGGSFTMTELTFSTAAISAIASAASSNLAIQEFQ